MNQKRKFKLTVETKTKTRGIEIWDKIESLLEKENSTENEESLKRFEYDFETVALKPKKGVGKK